MLGWQRKEGNYLFLVEMVELIFGYCVKYGFYSIIDLEQGIVVDIQFVQVIYIFFLFDKNVINFYYVFLFKDL